MFRKTSQKQQMGLFTSPDSLLNGRSERFYGENGSWHNLFRAQVTLRVEESLFEPLYSSENGSPNASIRVMVTMMILKEANRWSDSQLFEQCRFNLLVRSALGLLNMDDPIPSESTYYLFRKRIVEHERQGNPNLLEETFTAVTKGQAKEFQVSGRSIRMDSKLLGSNIAWLSRYELIHETLRLFCSRAGIAKLESRLSPTETDLVKSLLSEGGNKVVYRCSGEEISTRLTDLGMLAYRLVKEFEGSPESHYATVSRLFEEQFEVSGQKTVIPRPKESITADSVQSPHDTDCHYRDKDGNRVKGYSVNVTESCDKEGLNLISGVAVKKADAADNGFLEKGIAQAGEVFGDPAEKIHADGAYHSPANQEFVAKKNAELILSAIQGAKGRYDLEMGENGTMTVKDLQTASAVEALRMEKTGKWRIRTDGHYRYFSDKELNACLLRKKLAAIPRKVLNIRNNVEATIFQLGYHYPNDKTRYRGIIKHRMWANIRCLWVNFVRILKHVLKKEPATGFQSETGAVLPSGSIKNRYLVLIREFKTRFITKPNLFSKTRILAVS